MSANLAEGAVQHVDGPTTTAQEIGDFFNTIVAAGVQPRLRNVSGTCRFDVAGVGAYRVAVKDGAPTVTHNDTDTAPADCVVALSAEDFVRILRHEGYLDIFAAFLQGRIVVSGDLSLAATLLFSATLKPAGSPSR
jgi:hypothetical protein